MTDPNRKDRVGKLAPWPKGKPRNPVDPRWEKIRKRAVKALAIVDRQATAGTNVRSGAYIAALCGVSTPSVSKWLNNKNKPPASAVDIIENWLTELD